MKNLSPKNIIIVIQWMTLFQGSTKVGTTTLFTVYFQDNIFIDCKEGEKTCGKCNF